MNGASIRLSGAAERLLDGYVESLRVTVLSEAVRSQLSFPQREVLVSVDDIEDAFLRVQQSPVAAEGSNGDLLCVDKSWFKKFGDHLIVDIRLLVVVILLVAGLSTLSVSKLSGPIIGSVFGAFLGLTFSLVGYSFVGALRDRSNDALPALASIRPVLDPAPRLRTDTLHGDPVGALLMELSQFEGKLRSLVAARYGESMADKSISQLVDTLVSRGRWNKNDAAGFKFVMSIRNAIVHERNLGISYESVAEAIQELGFLRDKTISLAES